MSLVVAAGAIGAWTLLRGEVRANAEKYLFALVSEVARKAEGDVATALKTVVGIAEAIPPAALDRPAELEAFFHQLPSPLGWIGRCAAATPDGRIVAHNLPTPIGAVTSLAGRDYFRKAVAEKKPVVSAPLVSGISGMPAIALSVPRLDPDGPVRIVVTCGLVLTQHGVFGHVRDIRVGSSGYAYVATRERKIILHPDAARMPGDHPPQGADPLTERAAGGFEGTEAGVDSRGVPALTSVRQIPGLGWFVAAVYPVEEAYQSLQQLRERIVLMALAALALSVILAWFLAGWLVAPIARLTRHLGLLRQRPDAPMHALPRRSDEIGALTEAFVGLLHDLREREASLQSSREKFARAFHSNPHLILITRQRDGLIVEANEGFETLTGYTVAEAVGKFTLADLHLWADPCDRDEMVRRLAETGRVRELAVVLRRKDGELRDVTLSAATLDYGGEPHIIGTVHDYTDLKRSQEALRNSEERFAKAFHSNPDFSMISRLRDGCIIEANEGFEKLLGIPAAEAVGRLSVSDLRMWADATERERFVRLLDEQGSVRDLPATFLTRDGTRREVEISASTIDLAGEPHIIGTARDVTALKHSQAELRRSEERFAMFFRNNPDYATVSRLSDGTFVDVNRAFEVMTGWQREDVVGRTAAEIGLYVDPAERDWLVGELRAHGAVRDFEIRFRMRSGEVRLVQGAVVMVDLDGEPHIIGVARDITEIRRAEAALAKSEEKFSKAFHASPDWITVFRLEDGMVIETNEQIEPFCGYSPAQAVGRTTLDLGLWAHPEKRPRFVDELKTRGRVKDYPWEVRTRSGEVRDALIAAATITVDGVPCMISIVRDVTEQRRAERAIRTSEEKFSKVFQASPDWIVVVRLQDGLILDANASFARISGHSVDEAVGKTVGELNIWADPAQRTAFVRQLQAAGSVFDYPWAFLRKGGELRQGMIASVALELGGVPCLISIVRDITEARRAEAEILRLNADLESRVRARTAELEGALRELESFSYSISHDLRSPLRAIAGYARIIEEDYATRLDAEGNRLLGRIVGGAIRMSELIDDLLDFSRIGRAELKMVPVEMNGLVREVLGDMPEGGSGHHLQMRIGTLPAVVADRGLMRQVWANLLSNAIKYSRQRDPMVIEVGGAEEEAEAHFFVRDNGTGFDMQYAGKLFQVFQRLHRDPAFEGTGVGLAIVARIVQRHGGRVWAEAVPERGATFHFTLPRAAG